jgi:hypothetical protein
VGERTRIPGGIRVGRNVMIHPDCAEDDFAGWDIPSGETVQQCCNE